EHPPSPDYVPGPEHPPSPAEPLPANASPIALSSGYVTNSDPKEDPEEDPEEDHADYPANGGDGDDEPSDDDDDDTNDEDEEPFEDDDDDEEEEHLAPADSVIAPTVDYVPSPEEIEPFETDESATTPPSPPTHRTTARISIRPEAPMPFPSDEEVERLLALPPPPPSPLILLLLPSVEECLARCLAAPALPSSPLPIVPHLYGSPNHVCAPLGFKAAMGRLRASSPSTTSITTITTSTIITILITTCTHIITITITTATTTTSITIHTTISRSYEVGESSTAARPTRGHRADYGFIGTLDAETRLDVLTEDRQFHHETALLLDQEALASRESWAHSVGLSSAVHYELHAYRTHTQIQALQARDQTHADDPEGAGSSA
ncbi:hypothetical protein Tco_0689829, partial [Tanacetum coccineum]